MRYKALLSFFFAVLSSTAVAKWEKINDIDYTWGPFKIYNISLFTETGEYSENIRPIMLTLKYSKPVAGRDFAISVAKSWETLDINLPEQDAVIDHLRKNLPDLKPDDMLSYIALEDRGYFVLNDQVIPQEFNTEFNNAMLATWLDPKVDFSSKLTVKKADGAEQEVYSSSEYSQVLEDSSEKSKKIAASGYIEPKDENAQTEQAVDFERLSAKPSAEPVKATEPKQDTQKAAADKASQPAETQNGAETDKSVVPTAEPEKTDKPETAEPDKPVALPETAPQVDPENPEKEILPEFDPIRPDQPPLL